MIGSSCCSCCPESCGYLSNILIIWNMYTTRFPATRIHQGNLWQVRSLKKKMTELQTNLAWAWVSIAKKWCRTLSHQEPKDILCSLFRPNKGAKELRKEWLFYSGPIPNKATPMNNMTIWLELDCHHPIAAWLPQTNLFVAFQVKKCFTPRKWHFWSWVFWRSIKYHRVTKQHPRVLPTPFSSVKPPGGSINATLRGRDHHAVSSGSTVLLKHGIAVWRCKTQTYKALFMAQIFIVGEFL